MGGWYYKKIKEFGCIYLAQDVIPFCLVLKEVFHERLGISSLAEWLSASQGDLNSVAANVSLQ
jgi:hypothetical protein